MKKTGRIKSALNRLGYAKLSVRMLMFTLLTLTTGLAVMGVTVMAALSNQLTNQVDEQIQQTAETLAAQISGSQNDVIPSGESLSLPGAFFVLLVNENQEVVDSVKSLNATASLPDISEVVNAYQSNPREHFAINATSGEWRTYAVDVDSQHNLIISVSLEESEKTVNEFTRVFAILALTVLLIITLGGSFILERNLRPLKQVENSAKKINSGNLDERVPTFEEETEVGNLSSALNSMLERLQNALKLSQESETAAKDREEQMRRLTADVSHELRTPLTTIIGFSELALKDHPNQQLEEIHQQALRMSDLVEDLLMLARLEHPENVTLKEVDLVSTVFNVTEPRSALHPERNIEPIIEAAPIIMGEPNALERALGNLIDNALHYTDGDVVVVVKEENNHAIIEVADQGPGMDEETREKIFERFWRADTSRNRNTGGSGLGLSIVSSVIKAHQGKLKVTSNPKTGSVFRIILKSK